MATKDLGQVVGPQGEKGDTGSQGPQGIQGIQGVQGPAGPGVASGGSAGQLLVKQSSTDYDTGWSTLYGNGIPMSSTDATTVASAIGGKISTQQSIADAGKALGINALGQVVPVPFSGEDFTGATASTAGVHGYVPAPAAGDQEKVLTGAGTWETPTGARLLVVDLDTVTNTSGSYTHTTTVTGMTGDLKAVALECGDPTIFNGPVSVVTGADSVTLSCDDVAGTSTVKASFLTVGNGNPLSSTEYAALDTRIGQLTDLDTTDKSDIVSAINEVNDGVDTVTEQMANMMIVKQKSNITLSNGSYAGTLSSLVDDNKAVALLGIYFERGSYSANRGFLISMYGTAGYSIALTDGGTTVSTSATITAYYLATQ